MACAICGRESDTFAGGMWLCACHAGDDDYCPEEAE